MLDQAHQFAVALANALDPLYLPLTVLILLKVASILVNDIRKEMR